MSVETKGNFFVANDVSEFIASKYEYLGPAHSSYITSGRIEGDALSNLYRQGSSAAAQAAGEMPAPTEDEGPELKLSYRSYPR